MPCGVKRAMAQPFTSQGSSSKPFDGRPGPPVGSGPPLSCDNSCHYTQGFPAGSRILRFSIGHRLFVSVLLAMLTVAAAGIGLMRHRVMQSFSEYAVNIELDRLEELSQDLARRHAEHGSWG